MMRKGSGPTRQRKSGPSANGRRAAVLLILLAACSPGGDASTTVPDGTAQSPEAVAGLVLDALMTGDFELAAANTVEEQMVWLAMAEGASLQEAASLLEQGAKSVAINYWTGFTQLGEVPPIAISSITETDLGDHSFAVVSLGDNDDLRLVLRSEPSWKVDVVASFGSTLVARLADAVAVVGANSGEDADLLRRVLAEQKDSVDMAGSDARLNEAARQALADLADSLEKLSA